MITFRFHAGSAEPATRRRGLRILIGTDTYHPDVNGAAYFTYRLATGLTYADTRCTWSAPAPMDLPAVVSRKELLCIGSAR